MSSLLFWLGQAGLWVALFVGFFVVLAITSKASLKFLRVGIVTKGNYECVPPTEYVRVANLYNHGPVTGACLYCGELFRPSGKFGQSWKARFAAGNFGRQQFGSLRQVLGLRQLPRQEIRTWNEVVIFPDIQTARRRSASIFIGDQRDKLVTYSHRRYGSTFWTPT